MKTTKSIIVFIVSYMLFYLVLSSIGCIFFNKDLQHYTYSECIGNTFWFMMYNLFIGWWLAGIIANDYYETIKKN